MRIVMFSINPLFPGHVMGGAPKHLQNIALHLGALGHDVTILSTRTEGAEQPFPWGERVQVLPVLRFKQPFPQPYAVPAYDLAAILQEAGDHLCHADRFYMHDGEFLFPYAYRHVPTVVSLRDNVYPETLLGSFLFRGDRLVLISEYSRQYFLHTAGRFFPGLADRIEVIHNGLDWEKFKPVKPRRILDIIPVDLARGPIVLHPHRPEETKGIHETIAVIDLLVRKYDFAGLTALVPRWLDVQSTPELRAFYESIEHEIARRDLSDHFLFHEWVPQELMPEYYSLGAVTLSLGSFVESFGNAVYESLGCGTPSVVARISTHRELLPESLIDRADYGDIETTAALAARIIRYQERTSPETLGYLRENYSIQRQLDAYAGVILNARRLDDLEYRHTPLDDSTRFRLAPWCYRSERGFYHDFLARYFPLDGFSELLQEGTADFSFNDAARLGLTREEVLTCYRDGFLIPLAAE
jgi:glycosyltransferase involved in cell wall biosynthesis